jgi:Mn2+/Fe2+ NRAMP family transporter
MSFKRFTLPVSLFYFSISVKESFAAVSPLPNPGDGFATLDQLNRVFVNVASTISTFIGFAVLIMLITGGVRYITAQGDPKAVAAARATLTWAIVGLFVVLAAFAIIFLIAGFVSIPGLGRFCIPRGGGIEYSASCP